MESKVRLKFCMSEVFTLEVKGLRVDSIKNENMALQRNKNANESSNSENSSESARENRFV